MARAPSQTQTEASFRSPLNINTLGGCKKDAKTTKDIIGARLLPGLPLQCTKTKTAGVLANFTAANTKQTKSCHLLL